MNFHLIGMPHTQSNFDYNACAYTTKILHKIELLSGFTGRNKIYHYGNEGADVSGKDVEHIDVVPAELFYKEYGMHKTRVNNIYECDVSTSFVRTFNLSVTSEIRKRYSPGDFVICLYSYANQPIAEQLSDLQLFIVEASIGYYEVFAPYRVYESYAKQEFHKGLMDANYRHWRLQNPEEDDDQRPVNAIPYTDAQVTDDVIGAFLEPAEFEYKEKKEDYFLYLGRIVWEKGIEMAAKVAEELNTKLIVAGQGDYHKEIGDPPKCVELVGHADIQTRRELMANAKASFLLSHYAEPFGHVVIENNLSGTPIITTDWGSFPDIVRHGETGFRVRNFDEAVVAAKKIHKIDSKDCRNWGMNFTIDAVRPQYQAYYNRIKDHSQSENNFYWRSNLKDLDYRNRINPKDHQKEIEDGEQDVQDNESN